MKRFVTLIWSSFLITIRVAICLRITTITVPALKPRGDPATLVCEFDLEGGRLYSVKWYRDNEEFYRYMPKLIPSQLAHELDGVMVDLTKSSARRVHIRKVSLRSRGLYRCEVSEEAPSFYSAQAEAFMEVMYFPREAPQISGHDRKVNPGDILDLNCTSSMAHPAPDLQWQLNGQKVTDPSMLVYFEPQNAPEGLVTSQLGLRTKMRQKMRLKCTATIGNHRREKTINIESSGVTTSEAMRKIIAVTLLLHILYYCTNIYFT